MNGIFFVLVSAAVAAAMFSSPSIVMDSLVAGGEKAVELTVTMTAVYAVWLGILGLAEKSGLTARIAHYLKKPIRWLFGRVSEKAAEDLTVNISANLLGMGGVATPMGVAAARELDAEGNVYAMNMLFVIAATSIQLLPTTIISLLSGAGSANPGRIILPSLLSTFISTAIGVAGVRIFAGKHKVR